MEVSTRPRQTLSHQLSLVHSSNLRDLLKLREDEDDIRRRDTAVTLATILACEKQRDLPSSSSSSNTVSNPASANTRTLLDIIRNEDDPRSLIISGGHASSPRIRWKSLKNRLRRATAVWPNPACGSTSTTTTTTTVNITDAHGGDRSPPLPPLGGAGTVAMVEARNRPSSPNQPPILNPGPGVSAGRLPEQRMDEPIRASLMTLLEQNDRRWRGDHGTSTIASAMIGVVEEEDDDDDDDDDDDEEAETMMISPVVAEKRAHHHMCCVCMVRRKGAAFIPCGHTFCRLCSRELWVDRGNCPLCNGFILEVLDIFC